MNFGKAPVIAVVAALSPIAAALSPVAPAWAEKPAAEQQATSDEHLKEVDQRLRDLERKVELEGEDPAERDKKTTKVGVGKDGFFIESADGQFKFRLRGLLQFDGRFFDHDQDRPGTDTFVIRRARLILEGTVYGNFDFRIVPEFGGGQTVLLEAYIDARFSSLASLRAGKFKPPVGLERLQAVADGLFVEFSLPTNLVPNRDLGVEIYGEAAGGTLDYAAGVFNGVPDGASTDADTNNSKETAARLFALPFKTTNIRALQALGLGLADTYGANDGTPSAPGIAGYKTAGQQTFFSYRSDSTLAGTVVADGRRRRLSPQAYWYVGRFGLQAEYVRSRQEVELATSEVDLVNWAWQTSVSFFLTHDSASWKTVSPTQPFDPATRGWGAVELAARVGDLKVDSDAFPVFANPASSASEAKEWAGGVNWYLNCNLRFMLDYAWTRFTGGAPAGDREDERVLLTRFQIRF